MLKPIPVTLCVIENTEVRTFLWIDKCGDNGRLSFIFIIFIGYIYISIVFLANFKKK